MSYPLNVDFWVRIRNFAKDSVEPYWMSIVGISLVADISYFVVIFIRVVFYRISFDSVNAVALYDAVLYAGFIMWTLFTIVTTNAQIVEHLHLLGSVRYEFAMETAGGCALHFHPAAMAAKGAPTSIATSLAATACNLPPQTLPTTEPTTTLEASSKSIILDTKENLMLSVSSSSSSSSSSASSLPSSPSSSPPLNDQENEIRVRGLRTKSGWRIHKHKDEQKRIKKVHEDVNSTMALLALDAALEHLRHFDRLVTMFGLVIDKNLFLQMGALMLTGAASGLSKIISSVL